MDDGDPNGSSREVEPAVLAQGVPRGRGEATRTAWISLGARMLLPWLALALIALCACATEAWGATPNDQFFPLQWGDSNTGQSVPTQNANEELGSSQKGTPGADDRALSAWGVSTGTRSAVIGELDSGAQYTHPDLAANIWTNPGNIGGCPAGTRGFDAIKGSCYPQDEDEAYGGHGTHVAGIIGAVGNNGLGVTGMNWVTSILPVKWVQAAGSETDDLLRALQWLLRVSKEGVNIRVVNDSLTFSHTAYSLAVKKAIEALGERNILFVAAAGNTGDNNDEEAVRRYPCGYDLPNEICATAIDNRDELPKWANYGPHTVDLAAPGESIYSTLREGKYGYLSGGSMASAQVSGAAALILSVEPSLTAAELKTDLLGSVRALPSLKGKVITGGTLDVCRAMPGCEHSLLPSVTALTPSSLTQTSVTLNADVNPNNRKVTDCHFDFGNSSAYGASAQCKPMPGAGMSPVEVSAPISALSPNTVYHFRIGASTSAGTSVGPDQTFTTPPDPPRATALGASSLTQTSATLTASVNPHGGEVSDCHFDYGVSNAYGASAQCMPMPGNGMSPVEVSAPVGGLSPNTIYHFRIVANNRGGSSVGADQTFTTLRDPPSATALAPSSLAQTSVTLNASVNPHGGEVSDCHFDYGVSSDYGASIQCVPMPGSSMSPVDVSAAVGGLSPNTIYHFRIVASNGGGSSVGADQTFTTDGVAGRTEPSGGEPAPPAKAPGELAASPARATPPHTGAATPLLAIPSLLRAALSASSSGRVQVILDCPAGAESCVGEIALRVLSRSEPGAARHHRTKRKASLVAVAHFTIPAGTAVVETLTLSRGARMLLARTHLLVGEATLLARDVTGRVLSTEVRVTVKVSGSRVR